MPVTPTWNTVTVRHTYATADVASLSGARVKFTPTVGRLTDVASKTTIIARPVYATITAQNTIEIALPATDDPDIAQDGWTWKVEEEFEGGATYYITVPLTEAATGIDLADWAAVPAVELSAQAAFVDTLRTSFHLDDLADVTAPEEVLDSGGNVVQAGTPQGHVLTRVGAGYAFTEPAAVPGDPGGGGLADVRSLTLTGGPITATGVSTWVSIPGPVVDDAATGQEWDCYCRVKYRSTSVAGIKIRHKVAAAAVTNILPNPSFETDTAGWTASGGNQTTISRDTTAGGQDGTANLKVTTVTGGTTHQIFSDWQAANPGSVWSAGAYLKRVGGAARNCRADVQFTVNEVVESVNGSVVASGTAYARSITEGAVAPAGTTLVRVRLAVVTPVAGDVHHFDAVQLEPSATLPAYGSTGGSGAGALTYDGLWTGPKLAPAALTAGASEDGARRTILSSTVLTTEHGGLGLTAGNELITEASFKVTVGGTGLTGQRIELEFADRAADGTNHAQIVAVQATFARLQ